MLVPVLIALESLAVDETCPAAVDVAVRVRTILHLSPEQQLSEKFLVERREAGLYVMLRGADSVVVGERILPLEGSCDELAQAAAVVLSAWLTDVHPDFAGALPPPIARAPEPEPKPDVQAKPPVSPAPRAEVARRQAPVRRATRSVHRLEGGVALGADLTNGVFVPAGLASAGYGAEDRGFGFVVLANVTAAREESHAPGSIGWWRWPVAVGATYRLSTSNLSADLSLGPVAAWLRLEGAAFDINNTLNILAWGGFAAVRVSGRSHPLAPFGLLSLQVFPAKARAYVRNLEADWPIPRLTLVGGLGVRFSQ